jgi:ABC-type sugar transport system ATPase subunit
MEHNGSLLQIQDVSKNFPGVRALDHVSLNVQRGEVMALLGENGAGKSTLVKILSGAYTRDSGSIVIDGRGLPKQYSTLDARHLGIGVIYQELSLLPNLTVAENLSLTNEPLSIRWLRKIDYKAMRARARTLLAQLDAGHIPVDAKVRTLSLPEKQVVEIAKALAVECKVIVMDEPTTALTSEETQHLFNRVAVLKRQNVTVIYISHRLDEIAAIADRATVLRDGRVVATVNMGEVSSEQIISLITGKPFEGRAAHRETTESIADQPELLRADGYSDPKRKVDASLALHENEVLGIAGLVGSGRTEFARMIFGADPCRSGRLFLSGKEVHVRSPNAANRLGIGYLSKNRKEDGLNQGLRVQENVVLADLGSVSRFGVVRAADVRATTETYIDKLAIKGTPRTRTLNLSGGNQQKVVIAKWLHAACKVLIFDEPTRGIDVGAKAEIHELIREFATDGRGAIVISSEPEELALICDRILIMHKGKIVGQLTGAEITKDQVLKHVAGEAT